MSELRRGEWRCLLLAVPPLLVMVLAGARVVETLGRIMVRNAVLVSASAGAAVIGGGHRPVISGRSAGKFRAAT